ncbi:serine/threonine protein kinase [Sphaerisporangium album]|uniref:non-specific serine/threonine protein kinase n=1 Tax=Sphaerisporangium album TaxID=509200 RepID=A0A367FRZ0_9ACTN|nr:serine/threonine-protein kinase [Sphaerisporangium album]RCG32994.1 serine/threonine protein kinase [Sphaerisporangium album]
MSEARPGGRQQGRRVADRYQLLEPIGRGGMGVVWRAHDELLDRVVAVKEVRYPGDPDDDEVAELNRRTLREARAAGRLSHPNVVVVHDVIEENGRPWIVMQLVDSRSLGQVLREEGPLPARMVAEIGLRLLEALRTAHAAGVLHRDVKPENVLLTDDGRVVLTDFGIARMETDTTMTRTGLVGTPAFIAPERLRGYPAQRESDLWSLGATLYAAVEGRPPHDKGMAMATMHAVLNDEPEPAPRAGRLGAVLMGLLEKNPQRRLTFDQAERMLRAIAEDRSATPRSSMQTLPAAPHPIPATSPPRKRPRPEGAVPLPAEEASPAAVPPPASTSAEEAASFIPATGVSTPPQSLKAPVPAPNAPGGDVPADGSSEAAGVPQEAEDGSEVAPVEEDAKAYEEAAHAEVPAPAQETPDEDDESGEGPPESTTPASSQATEAGSGNASARIAPVQPVKPTVPAQARAGDAEDVRHPARTLRQEGHVEPETRQETRRRPYGDTRQEAPAAPGPLAAERPVAVSAEAPESSAFSGFWETSRVSPTTVGPPPGEAGSHPRRSLPIPRLALVIIPIVLVVAGVALWLGARDASDPRSPGAGASASGGDATSPATGPPSSATSSPSGEPSTPASSPAATPSKSPKPSSSPKPTEIGPGDVPEGWRKYKHSSGFSVALPKGWSEDGRGNGLVRFRGDSHTYLEVHHTSSPEKDALKVWHRDVPGMSRNFPGYRLVAIREVKGYWQTAADWEFTFGDSRFRSHVIDRGFVTDKNNGYALLYKTDDKDWKQKKKLFETLAATFKPAK